MVPANFVPVGAGRWCSRCRLVDDVDRCHEADLLALEQWLTSGSGPLALRVRAGATVVVAGSTTWFSDGFRGCRPWPAAAR